MRIARIMLPLVCSVPVLLGCSAPAGSPPNSANAAMRIEPVLSIRNSDSTARGLYQLGRYYQGQNRLEQAADAYRRALQFHADYIEAHSALGAIYSGQGKFEQAIAELEAALKTAPHLAHIHNNLGYVYYLQGHYDEAIAAFDKAISLEPANPRAYNNLGSAYLKLGEADKSQLAFAHATALMAHADSGAHRTDYALAVNELKTPAAVTLTNSATSVALAPPQPTVALPLREPDRGGDGRETAAVLPEVGATFMTATDRPQPLVARTSQAQRPALVTTEAAQTGKTFHFEIANGNGVTGLARRMGNSLRRTGMPASRLTNLKPYQQQITMIQYRDGYRDEALQLRGQLGKPPLLINNNRLRSSADVQLVLGRDVLSL